MRYRIVDVFSEEPLAGNALCVVLDECSESDMQRVAREVNLSETTFPSLTGQGSYRNRIFTPSVELPFAGHPTLGTAFVLGPGQWEQTTSGAVVRVEVDNRRAEMIQPDPVTEHVEVPTLADVLGLSDVLSSYRCDVGGVRFLVALTECELSEASPKSAELSDLVKAYALTGVCMVRRRNDEELSVRVFVPSAGIDEDPGTGSAAGPIGLVAHEILGTAVDVTIRQGAEVGRPCRIEVHAERGNVRVGGSVASCAEGRFHL